MLPLPKASGGSRHTAARAHDTLLADILAGAPLAAGDYQALMDLPWGANPELFSVAAALRDRGQGDQVTYSPKVFLPITNLCRDRCSYCTFRKDPGDPGAWTMGRDEIVDCLRRGRAQGCTEALLCLGDKPEKVFRQYRTTLAALGHTSTVGYVREACELALQEGLLPHTNMGVLTREEMAFLRPVNASLGLMLENVSPRLRMRGMAHYYAPDKDPAVRLQMIHDAGDLAIPFTTGILVGMGETPAERVDSLLALRDLHERYGHLQEIIIQNFRAKPGTAMEKAPELATAEMARTIAIARLILGPHANIQAPPNLSPHDHRVFLQAGINDWGGISPVTSDYVNPEAPWPHVELLRRTCADAGFVLRPRLCIYPGYISRRWIDPCLLQRVVAMARDVPGAGTCSAADARAGGSLAC